MAKKELDAIEVGIPNLYDNVPISKKIKVREIREDREDLKEDNNREEYDSKEEVVEVAIKESNEKAKAQNVTKQVESKANPVPTPKVATSKVAKPAEPAKSATQFKTAVVQKSTNATKSAIKPAIATKSATTTKKTKGALKCEEIIESFNLNFRKLPDYKAINGNIDEMQEEVDSGIEWLDDASMKLKTGKAKTFTSEFNAIKRDALQLLSEVDETLQLYASRDILKAHEDMIEGMKNVFFNSEFNDLFAKEGYQREFNLAKQKLTTFLEQKEICIGKFKRAYAGRNELKQSYLDFEKIALAYLKQHPQVDKGRDL